MDVLAPTTMKNAVKCDTSCELQNPVSHQIFERNLHFLSREYVCRSVGLYPPPHFLIPWNINLGEKTVKSITLLFYEDM